MNTRNSSFLNFETAVQGVLEFLHKRIGFQLWMFTRVEGQDWIVLEAHDHGYGISPGDVFQWSDSFCSRMIEGLGPRIAPISEKISAYVEAPINQKVNIGSYIGIPLHNSDGSLFGTLCAIDPNAQSESILQEKELIELQAQLLTTILNYELLSQENARRYERAEAEAQRDSLTNLYNRRGWDNLLIAEEARAKQFGQPLSVIIVDLDNLKYINDNYGHAAGDSLIRTAAACLEENIRSCDLVARLGGDEFGILLVDINASQTKILIQRIKDELEKLNIQASFGWQKYSHKFPLSLAIEKADKKMYQQKIKQKQLNLHSTPNEAKLQTVFVKPRI
ncbi:GGDEF domain-containing protein [Crocosphaera chwakensis]|uniref:GGDEF domain-containing protein n=1 Tax=Crocosphaera chwakensis CCY0110 TaxID=391612 RepID=A3IKN7_9CHRO|nr:sensor domain-containing diguanylate cyclase [Crocosphaera chwakensis]EAZ92756.1 hypothetical protein CY0110_21707 [Crocosphaera chwakensis CCY0110]